MINQKLLKQIKKKKEKLAFKKLIEKVKSKDDKLQGAITEDQLKLALKESKLKLKDDHIEAIMLFHQNTNVDDPNHSNIKSNSISSEAKDQPKYLLNKNINSL